MGDQQQPAQLEFTEADKTRARQWFRKAADCRERREYDYAIECFITGLGFWPEAVEEGHMPLSSVAVQRLQAGGKKPGMLEAMKKPTSGKDSKQAMLNAELLWCKDPTSATYVDAFLKNAARAGYAQTLKWLAPKAMESLRKDAKPSAARFKAFRAALVEAAELRDADNDAATAAFLYEQAVASVEYQLARAPGDAALRDEQRDLSGKLTISRGKYSEAGTFRESLHEGDKQKMLHDSERVKQGEQTQTDVISAAKAEWEANPTVPQKLVAYADLLIKTERPELETQAIEALLQGYATTQNYSFKVKADDVRMRQLKRTARALREQAGTDDGARQQARLAESELVQAEVEIYRERAQKYPTDVPTRYRLGEALFRAGQFDEAIPVLQAGQSDPRTRLRSQLIISRCFFEKQAYGQTIAVLSEALQGQDLASDELIKEMLYWLARAQEASEKREDAKQTLGRLLRIDYNYRNGDARKRMESLN